MTTTETEQQTSTYKTIGSLIGLENFLMPHITPASSANVHYSNKDVNATVHDIIEVITNIMNKSLHDKVIVKKETSFSYGRKLRYQVQTFMGTREKVWQGI